MAAVVNKLAVVKEFGVPKTVKVAVWVGISAALTVVLNNVADLKLDANKQMLLVLVINALLAGLKDVKDNL